jgi:hypothetical protein
MSTYLRSLLAPLCFVAVLTLASCSGRYDVVLRADGGADVKLSASIEPLTARLITNLAGFASGSGALPSEPLLNADALMQSLKASPGVASASLRNPDARNIAGTIVIRDMERFLATSSADGSLPAARFIRVERSASGGRLTVSLDRAVGPALLVNLSPDIVDYLSALMAPIATGEELSREEYLRLVTSMYGNGIAAEIAGATIRSSIELPGTATSVRGGTMVNRRVDFSIPLVDLLVLEKPLILEAVWK